MSGSVESAGAPQGSGDTGSSLSDVGAASPLAPWFRRERLALLTDFYEVTMMGGYLASGISEQPACFEYFFRRLPPNTGYCVTAGLTHLLEFLEHLHFAEDDLAYLESLDMFPQAFLDRLAALRFTGTLRAIPEGSVVFPNEPIVQVEAPLIEAQLIETFLLNALNYPTLIATKAARCAYAAEGDPVLEFGLRRAQGPDGGICGARAAMIGGCAATSNVMAGKLYDVPVKGTQAHSWIMAFQNELDAFRAYVHAYPENPTLLVDTYDTLECGVPNAICAFQEALADHPHLRASIRLDSGDLAAMSKGAYKQLTEAGFEDPLIVASSELDEDLIADIKRQGAKINAWGVGTHLITSRDYPALGGVYKLMAVEDGGTWQAKIKLSSNPEKTTNPGRKQLVRYFDEAGAPLADVMYDSGEAVAQGPNVAAVDSVRLHEHLRVKGVASAEPLLQTYIKDGCVITREPTTLELKARAQARIEALPAELKRLRNPHEYRVLLSPALAEKKRNLLVEYLTR